MTYFGSFICNLIIIWCCVDIMMSYIPRFVFHTSARFCKKSLPSLKFVILTASHSEVCLIQPGVIRWDVLDTTWCDKVRCTWYNPIWLYEAYSIQPDVISEVYLIQPNVIRWGVLDMTWYNKMRCTWSNLK